MKKGVIRIGTSGWHYPHWKNVFYPEGLAEKKQLEHYAGLLSTVELNNPFYRLPEASTFMKWKDTVPEGFVFAVKASRYITHLKKLQDTEEALQLFIKNSSHLKEKLGPVLFQLPPGWKQDTERLALFLRQLPPGYRFTFEFRNPSWYEKEVFDLLEKHNAAFCIYELNRHMSPLAVTADFVYIRLHGPGAKYEGSYPDKTLKMWLKHCLGWASEGRDVYLYFDNDQKGYAAANAIELSRMVAEAEAGHIRRKGKAIKAKPKS